MFILCNGRIGREVKRRALKDLKARGEVLVARGLHALDALRIARGLKEQTAAGAEFVEDKSMANELKVGDMVQATSGKLGLKDRRKPRNGS